MTWKTIPMALLRVEINDKTLGIVRNHKAGSTTAMNYIGQALAGWTPTIEPHYKLWRKTFGLQSYIHKHGTFQDYAQELSECDIRVALWRHPVRKFVSGFHHTMFSVTGAQDGLWVTGPRHRTIHDFLDHYDHYSTNLNVLDHCSSNTRKLGPSKEPYTMVLPLYQIDQFRVMLEQMTNKNIHPIRKRQQIYDYDMNQELENRIKAVLEDDYQNGWYSG